MINKILSKKNEMFFQINITQFCDLSCKHCYLENEERKIKKVLTERDYLLFFDKILLIRKYYQNKYKFVENIFLQILGGEPLSQNIEYYTTLFSHIKILKEKLKKELNLNLNLEVATNLVSLKFREKEWIELFKNFNNNDLIISTSYEIDTRRFNNKNYNTWIENIDILKENNIKLDLNFILTKGNVELILKNEEWLMSLFKKFENIYMYYFISYGNGNKNEQQLLPNYEDVLTLLNNIKNGFYDLNINGLFEENKLVFEEDELFNINLTPYGKINYNLDVFDIEFSNNIDDNINDIISNLNKYINWNVKNKLSYIMKTCNSCKFLDECLGGIEEYSNITFNNYNDCKGFKKFR